MTNAETDRGYPPSAQFSFVHESGNALVNGAVALTGPGILRKITFSYGTWAGGDSVALVDTTTGKTIASVVMLAAGGTFQLEPNFFVKSTATWAITGAVAATESMKIVGVFDDTSPDVLPEDSDVPNFSKWR